MAKIFQKKKRMDILNKKLINSIGVLSANTINLDETETEQKMNGNNLHENTFESKTPVLLEYPASLQITNTDNKFTYTFQVKSLRMPFLQKSTVKEGSELPVTKEPGSQREATSVEHSEAGFRWI